MSILGIRVLGSPVLRQSTTPVTVFDDEFQRLVDDMFETMYRAQGIGLAAPQVGRSERMAVVDVDGGAPLVVVNPTIVTATGRDKSEEGCLSIPDLYGDVERPAQVVVKALDREGNPFELQADALLARCLQHEIDHLHGRLFIDYLSMLKRRALLAKWEDAKSSYPDLVRDVASEPPPDRSEKD